MTRCPLTKLPSSCVPLLLAVRLRWKWPVTKRPLDRQDQLWPAVAMAPPKTRVVTYSTDGLDSSLPETEATKEKTPAPLSIKSRNLIREYFAETRPINLPQGHPVIMLTQDQMSTVLRIVADETAKASYDMLNSVMVRAIKPRPWSIQCAIREATNQVFPIRVY